MGPTRIVSQLAVDILRAVNGEEDVTPTVSNVGNN